MNVAQSAAVIRDKDEEIALLKATIEGHLHTISEANAKIRSDESVRRKLHNTILELKVSHRCTLCRIRHHRITPVLKSLAKNSIYE